MSIICHFSDLSVAFNTTPLFTGLEASLPDHLTGLTGPNGGGKSVLLQLLAGLRTPDRGTIRWTRPVLHVPQLSRLRGPRVAEALGVGSLHDTFTRVGEGRGTPEDLERIADRWHLPAQWQQGLDEAALPATPDTPVSALSGGEQTRLALCAAFLREDHYLLLDEPGNHLDREGRRWLSERVQSHPGGALVASHDRSLLRQVGTLLELREGRLRHYGGNYDLYTTIRNHEITALEQQIQSRTKALENTRRQEQEAIRKAARRRRQGEKLRRSGSQSKLMLDAQVERAQHSRSRQHATMQARDEALSLAIRQARAERDHLDTQTLHFDNDERRGGISVVLDRLLLPRGQQEPISLTVRSGDRWRIDGPNGSGKSTLLQIIAGQLPARSGDCTVHGRCLHLDQHFELLDHRQSAVDNLRRLHPESPRVEWRTRLGSLRLRGEKALQPVGTLSGGEQLKVALLAITGGENPPDLLLLDEPDNHLDLDSRTLLEQALRGYAGTLMLVTHDDEFAREAGADRVLALGAETRR